MTAGRIYNGIQDELVERGYIYESDSQFLRFYFYDRNDERVAELHISNDTVFIITEDGNMWDIDCYHRPMKSIVKEVLEELEKKGIVPVIGVNPVEEQEEQEDIEAILERNIETSKALTEAVQASGWHGFLNYVSTLGGKTTVEMEGDWKQHIQFKHIILDNFDFTGAIEEESMDDGDSDWYITRYTIENLRRRTA